MSIYFLTKTIVVVAEMFALKVSPAVMGNVLTVKQIILIVGHVGIYVTMAKYVKILNVLM